MDIIYSRMITFIRKLPCVRNEFEFYYLSCHKLSFRTILLTILLAIVYKESYACIIWMRIQNKFFLTTSPRGPFSWQFMATFSIASPSAYEA